jgi:hypothetical protein
VRAADRRPRHVKQYQASLTSAGLPRTTINGYVARIRRALKWGVDEEIVPAEVLTAIQAVQPLKGAGARRERRSRFVRCRMA